MKQMMKLIRVTSVVIFLMIVFHSHSFAQLTERQRADVVKNLDVFNEFFKRTLMNYVDSLDTQKLMTGAINHVLNQLDPYSEYIPSQEMSEFQFMTTGEYGGIGAVISMQEDTIIIREPYEGMPAASAGLLPGDRILSIDGESMEGKNTKDASEKLKGQPNTTLKLTYQRVGEKNPKEVTIERKRVHINPITYYGKPENQIGYISMSSFTVESAQSFKNALIELTSDDRLQGLIIDVRDNGGGVLEECLEILNFFLPEGEILLSIKGKNKQYEKNFRATQAPLQPELPLVVLVNGSSASASEILAGTIQDLDRGVIIGNRTFGKGLVQSSQPMPYGGQLKLTTSKYYIPSERSIQRINYSHRDGEGRADEIPDSLTSVYHTKNGRQVRDGGGILPDFVIEPETIPTIIYYLEMKSMFFDFVVQWRKDHPNVVSPSEFVMTDEIYSAFKDFVRSKEFTYDRLSEQRLEALKKSMELEGYSDMASSELEALEKKVKPDLDRDFEFHKDLITEYLSMHIMRQYYHVKGQLIYSLKNDKALSKAIELLNNETLYRETLQPAVEEK
ncbi:MAG: S41 family peptidase [Dysgonamonadaceae bacterium]|jgi:carboxyl-terminal processing protease|nr:S41 family peptidase [Dysgonamonadaceae bacterium]